MVSQRREPSFRAIVEAVKATPQVAPPDRVQPGIDADGTVVAPGGRTYRRTARDISAADAFTAAAAGAQLAWDPCGCGGYCGLTWFDEATVARMVVAGRPHIRRTKNGRGAISTYRSDDGHILLLAEDTVRWGSYLA